VFETVVVAYILVDPTQTLLQVLNLPVGVLFATHSVRTVAQVGVAIGAYTVVEVVDVDPESVVEVLVGADRLADVALHALEGGLLVEHALGGLGEQGVGVCGHERVRVLQLLGLLQAARLQLGRFELALLLFAHLRVQPSDHLFVVFDQLVRVFDFLFVG